MRCPAPGKLREKERLLVLPGCCVVGEPRTGKEWPPGWHLAVLAQNYG